MVILHCLLNPSDTQSGTQNYIFLQTTWRQSGNGNSGPYTIRGFKTPHIIFQRISKECQGNIFRQLWSDIHLYLGKKGAKSPRNLELLAAESQYSWCFVRHYLNPMKRSRNIKHSERRGNHNQNTFVLLPYHPL